MKNEELTSLLTINVTRNATCLVLGKYTKFIDKNMIMNVIGEWQMANGE